MTNPLAGKRAVIVEDEGITQMQLRMILARAGMQVVGFAVNGEDGVRVALRERPDLILMDIKMPGNVDGLQAAQQILSVYPTCVVLLTAYGDYAEQARQIGASGYVVKPVDFTTLLPRLREAYERFMQLYGAPPGE